MKRNIQTALCFCLCFFVFTVNAQSDDTLPEVRTVTVWGETTETGDPVGDKKRALANARREAVERVVGAYVTSETLVENFQVVKDRIYSKAGGFINSYEILREEHGEMYRILIQARVSITPVTEILRNSGLLRQWRVGIIMAPERSKLSIMSRYYSSSGISGIAGRIETVIGQRLIEAGFKVVDPRYLKKLRKKLEKSGKVSGSGVKGMDLLVTGTIQLDARRTGNGNIHQAVCQIYSKVLRVDTGEIVYQRNVGNTFDGVTLLVDHDVAMKYADSHGNGFLDSGSPDLRIFSGGADAALNKAIRLSSEMCADIMMSEVTRLPAAVSSSIALEIHGVDFNSIMELEELLRSFEGVVDVIAEEFAGGMQNMEVEYDGDSRNLARSLSRSKFCKKNRLKVTRLTKSKIIMKVQ